jgi:hypothetical protein
MVKFILLAVLLVSPAFVAGGRAFYLERPVSTIFDAIFRGMAGGAMLLYGALMLDFWIGARDFGSAVAALLITGVVALLLGANTTRAAWVAAGRE